MREVQASCLRVNRFLLVCILGCLLSLTCLGLVGCSAPFVPAESCETPNATFYLQQGVTRTCDYYARAMSSALAWDEAAGFFAGSPSHLSVYVYGTEVFDGLEGRWNTLTHDMELGQSAGALSHELLHVIFGELHHEGWEYLGAKPGSRVAYTMDSPDTGQPLQVLYTSYYYYTQEWNRLWLNNPNASDLNAMTAVPDTR